MQTVWRHPAVPSDPYYPFWAPVPSPNHLHLFLCGASIHSTCRASWQVQALVLEALAIITESQKDAGVCVFLPCRAITTVNVREKSGAPWHRVGWLWDYLTPEFSDKARLKLPVEPFTWRAPLSASLLCFSYCLTCLPWEHFLNKSPVPKVSPWHLLLENLIWVGWQHSAFCWKSWLDKKNVGHDNVFTLE